MRARRAADAGGDAGDARRDATGGGPARDGAGESGGGGAAPAPADPGAALVAAAARGRLPPWARMRSARRGHAARVAVLMEDWAERLGLAPADRERWLAAAWLHDALRDADDVEALRSGLDSPFREWPAPLLHGPAAAARLRRDGVADESLLMAVAWHTVGHPALDRLGRALYLADYLEPGRTFDPARTAALRARMPGAMDEVLVRVVADRIAHLLERGRPIRAETAAFWNALTGAA